MVKLEGLRNSPASCVHLILKLDGTKGVSLVRQHYVIVYYDFVNSLEYFFCLFLVLFCFFCVCT